MATKTSWLENQIRKLYTPFLEFLSSMDYTPIFHTHMNTYCFIPWSILRNTYSCSLSVFTHPKFQTHHSKEHDMDNLFKLSPVQYSKMWQLFLDTQKLYANKPHWINDFPFHNLKSTQANIDYPFKQNTVEFHQTNHISCQF